MSVVVNIAVKPASFAVVLALVAMVLLLALVAMVSAAESAFFSLNPSDRQRLKISKNKVDLKILELIDQPKRVLATLLISINFINIAIVILSTLILSSLFDFSYNPTLGFIIQVVAVTFLILLIGEVIPKIYATQNPLKTSRFMLYPVVFLQSGLHI